MTVFLNFFYKILAFFFAILVFLILITIIITFSQNLQNNSQFSHLEGDVNSKNKIALLKLRGPILNESSNNIPFGIFDSLSIIYVNEVKKILANLETEKIKGLIISINSPGGSVSATNNLYKLLNDFKNTNNIKIYFHTSELLASGGYWAALVSDKIYADYGALIGSIGVRGPDWIYYDNPIAISDGIIGKRIETKNGIKIYKNIAGESKDLFDPFRIPTERELKDLKKIVNSIYQDFVLLVSKQRNIEKGTIINEIGAMIFDATEAKNNFLINDVINLEETINELIKDLNIKNFQIIEMKNIKLSFMQLAAKINYNNKKVLFDNKKYEICNILNESISVLITQKDINQDC